MACEEEFGIVIPDETAEQCATVGGLYEVILAALPELYPSDRCHTSAGFYRLRRALMQITGGSRGSIRPDTLLEDLLPVNSRQANWKSLQASVLGRPLPDLVRPRWMFFMILLSAIPICLIAGIVGLRMVTAIAMVMAWWIFAVIVTRRRRINFPPGIQSLRDLVFLSLPKSESGNTASPEPLSPEGIWSRLQQLVVQQLGVRPEQVTREARFVHDLGTG